MGSNPLVAAPGSVGPGAFDGVYLVQDIQLVQQAVASHSWVDGAIGGISMGLDTAAAVSDPLGTVLGYGFGWVMEHIKPLHEALDAIGGDPASVNAHAQTWKNISAQLKTLGAEHDSAVQTGTADWTGDASTAYRAWAGEQGQSIAGLASAADTMALATEAAGMVVATVRTLVRDLISQVAGKAASVLAEEVFTLGLATPVAIEQVTTFGMAKAAEATRVLRGLTTSMRSLSTLLERLGPALREIERVLAKLHLGSGKAPVLPHGGTHGETSAIDNALTHPAGHAPEPALAGPPGHTSRPPADREYIGDPVDIASGEMFMGERDVCLTGSLPLILSRQHISSWRAGRWFGPSWSSTLDTRIELRPDQAVLATEEALSLRFDVPPAGGSTQTRSGPAWTLTRNDVPAATGSSTSVPDFMRVHAADADITGDLWSAIDQNTGLQWWFGPVRPVRDPAGTMLLSLLGVSNPGGIHYLVSYRADGTPESVRHSSGSVVTVGSEQGRISSYELVATNGARLLRTFRYDPAQRLVAVGDPDGSEHHFEYDPAGRIARWEDRTGFWYRYEYDALGRVIASYGPDDTLRTAVEYHDDGSRTTTNSLGAQVRYETDQVRHVVAITDPLGARTTFRRDSRHRLLEVVDPLGRVSSWERDLAGRVTAYRIPGGATALLLRDDRGRVVERIDPGGAVHRFEWDPADRLASTTDPLGAVTRFSYDPGSGGLSSILDPAGNATSIECDRGGMPIRATVAPGESWAYSYDSLGNLARLIDPAGGTTSWERDTEGRPLSKELPDGSRHHWAYDGEGHLVSYTDPAGLSTRYEIGHFGSVAARINPDGTRVALSYDSELRLTGVTDPRGLTWRYEYDRAGRLLREIDYDGVTTRFERDLAGRTIQNIAAEGTPDARIHRFRFNDANQLTSVASTTPADEQVGMLPLDLARYSYDEAGRPASIVSADHELSFEYDGAGRLTRESLDGQATSYDYDVLGRQVGRTLPDGTHSSWSYDPIGRPVSLETPSIRVSFAYDEAGRPVRTTTSSPATPGLMSRLDHRFDRAGRLLSHVLTADDPVAQSLGVAGRPRTTLERSYAWREDGYLTRIEDSLIGGTDFQLDDEGRVIGASGSDGAREAYSYDEAGNLTSAQWPDSWDVPTTAAETRGGREFGGTRVLRAGRTTYTYDRLGRLIARRTRTLSGQIRTISFSWNQLSQLSRVNDGASEWRYSYDGLGRRRSKAMWVDGIERSRAEFLWDGTRVAGEINRTTSGPESRVWDYLPGTSTVLTQSSMTSKGLTGRLVITDSAGTPTHLVDPAGGLITWSRRSTVWGVRRQAASNAGADDCPLDHPGQMIDAETGTHYNYFRHYDPSNATYTSNDPLGLVPGPNQRSYVNNPGTVTDPLGLSTGNTWYSGPPSGYTHLGNGDFRSPAGLVYRPEGPSSQFNHRIEHVRAHSADDLNKPLQGVFDPGENPLDVTEEAWNRIHQHQSTSVTWKEGNIDVYIVNMERDIGYVGGVHGSAAGNPAASYLRLVVKNGNEVISSYPYSGIPMP